MTELEELYADEEAALLAFEDKFKSKVLASEDEKQFIESYRDLLAQSKVMTRISDRLQAKLNNANERIANQNSLISEKNNRLTSTINQLVQARVSKKASTILLTVAIVLFISEELVLGQLIAGYVDLPLLGLAIKGLIALVLKATEGTLEGYFMKQEQMKIIDGKMNPSFEYPPHLTSVFLVNKVPAQS